jgi:hypothetical protein
MARPPKLQHLGLPKAAPGERLPRLQTTIASSPANPGGDPNIRAHEAGEAAGKVIGGGLGALIVVALIILMLGPVLWAPLWAGLRAARLAPDPWWPWLAGLAVGLLASLVQALLLVQRSPVLRYPIAVLFAAAWVGGLWLELTSPPHDWVTTAPTLHAPGPWSWALIGAGTVLYAGLYLLVLGPVNKGRWVRRWQLIR